jgi:ethanolamine ammonia-lyase large subunit
VSFAAIKHWTIGALQAYLLDHSEADIKAIMPGLHSDVIAAATKLRSNDALIAMGQKVFNPLPDSQLGAKGHMGARIQSNAPTDHPEDIAW